MPSTPGDLALESFSIERDRQALLPFIRAAQRVAGAAAQAAGLALEPAGLDEDQRRR